MHVRTYVRRNGGDKRAKDLFIRYSRLKVAVLFSAMRKNKNARRET